VVGRGESQKTLVRSGLTADRASAWRVLGKGIDKDNL
jgi:hypothetical protein